MGVLRHNRKRGYTTIPNEIFYDRRLNLKDIGLLTFLLHLPDGWDFSVLGLCSVIPNDGKSAICASLKRLEQAGYLSRKFIRGKDGKILDCEWNISDEPCDDFRHTGDEPQNNKEIKQEEKDKVATASQSQRAAVSSEDEFAELSQEYGEERAVNALQGVNDYIDKLYPLFRKKMHPSISKKDRVLFAERLLNCANQTDLTDEDVLYVIETALKNEKRGDPTILLVTTPSVLGYWIAMDDDFGFSHIKGTEYEFGEYKFCFS